MPRLVRMLAVALSAALFVPVAAHAETDHDRANEEPKVVDSDANKDASDKADEEDGKHKEKAEKRKHKRPARPTLSCVPKVDDDQLKAVCTWDSVDHSAVEGWKLVRRGGGEGRVVIADGDGVDDKQVLDNDIVYNRTYKYRLVLTNEDGQRVRASKVDRVRAKRPRFERLSLECFAPSDNEEGNNEGDESEFEDPEDNEGDVATTEITEEEEEEEESAGETVVCEWSEANYNDVATYQLLRKVPGQKREVIAQGDTINNLRFEDEVPEGVDKAKYRLRTLDEDGRRIGKSKKINVWLGF